MAIDPHLQMLLPGCFLPDRLMWLIQLRGKKLKTASSGGEEQIVGKKLAHWRRIKQPVSVHQLSAEHASSWKALPILMLWGVNRTGVYSLLLSLSFQDEVEAVNHTRPLNLGCQFKWTYRSCIQHLLDVFSGYISLQNNNVIFEDQQDGQNKCPQEHTIAW